MRTRNERMQRNQERIERRLAARAKANLPKLGIPPAALTQWASEPGEGGVLFRFLVPCPGILYKAVMRAERLIGQPHYTVEHGHTDGSSEVYSARMEGEYTVLVNEPVPVEEHDTITISVDAGATAACYWITALFAVSRENLVVVKEGEIVASPDN